MLYPEWQPRKKIIFYMNDLKDDLDIWVLCPDFQQSPSIIPATFPTISVQHSVSWLLILFPLCIPLTPFVLVDWLEFPDLALQYTSSNLAETHICLDRKNNHSKLRAHFTQNYSKKVTCVVWYVRPCEKYLLHPVSKSLKDSFYKCVLIITLFKTISNLGNTDMHLASIHLKISLRRVRFSV